MSGFLFCVVAPLLAIVVTLALIAHNLKGVGGRGIALLLFSWLLDLPACFARSVIGFILSGFIVGPVWSLILVIVAVINFILVIAGVSERTLIGFSIASFSGGMFFALLLSAAIGLFIGFAPLFHSILTAIGMVGGKYLAFWEMGARRLSRRESGWVLQSAQQLQLNPKIRRPKDMMVIDRPDERAFYLGSTLVWTRGALHGANRTAILAAALGHFNSPSSRIRLALRRLPTPIMHTLARAVRASAPGNMIETAMTNYAGATFSFFLDGFTALLAGGFGLWLLRIPYHAWLIETEYRADAFAKNLGQRVALRRYIETLTYLDTAVPYMGAIEPSVELRLERLEETTQLNTAQLKPQPVK